MKEILNMAGNALVTVSGQGETLALKSLALLAVTLGLMALWRRGAASARHLAWVAVFLCLLCLPGFVRFMPVWHPPAWMAPASFNGNLPDVISLVTQKPAGVAPAPSVQNGSGVAAAAKSASSQTDTVKAPVAPVAIPWGGIVSAIWMAGILLGGLRWLVAQARLWRLAVRLPESMDAVALGFLEDLRGELGVWRPVRLLVSETSLTPVTWGLWRPVIVLPVEAEQWPAERVRVVLRHELAHVRRWDCLTQELAHLVCLLYWFNPLVWVAARRMRVEREAACDDLVLNAGAAPVEYAGHLVEIARQFAGRTNLGGAVAMARPSGLEQRVKAILDARRDRGRMAGVKLAAIVAVVFGLGLLIGSYGENAVAAVKAWSLEQSPVEGQLKHFVAEKEAQAVALLADDEKGWQASSNPADHNLARPDLQPFFAAAAKGDWLSVTNEWASLEPGIRNRSTNNPPYPHGKWASPMNETYGAIEAFGAGDEKYSILFGEEIIQSMPPGSIYFGGTDAGRFIVTALSRSQIKGDPIFTLTQNALADGTYLDYLRSMYGDQIKLPGALDQQKAFQDYVADLKVRAEKHQLEKGENYSDSGDGRVQISGVTAVMTINGLLVKDIFDANTHRDFYVEQSYPLKWMYPNLEPHGLIFKLDREPVSGLPDDMVKQNAEYWAKLVTPMIGDWLDDAVPVAGVVAFAKDDHASTSFKGDRDFLQNAYSAKAFAKLRESQAGLYVWRMDHASNQADKDRMAKAADLAFKQALALYPRLPETMEDYTNFLMSVGRSADAALVASLAPAPPVFQMRLVDDALSADNEQMMLSYKQSAGLPDHQETVYVNKTVLLDQTMVASASVSADEFSPGRWLINIDFTEAGKKKFAEVTQLNLHKRLAILLDGKLWSAPMIAAPIESGKGQITGAFTEEEAKGLVEKINRAGKI